MYPVLDAFYDTDTHTLEISCDEPLEGEVYLYDIKGNIEDYSPELKACFNISQTGYHMLVIDTEDWIAEGSWYN